MQKEETKFVKSTVFEGMTSIRAILRGIDAGTNGRKITKILYDKARLSKIGKTVGYLRAISENYGFSLTESCGQELDELTLGTSHGGVIAITEERPLPFLTEETKLSPDGFYALIQGIEDPFNFGYALRSLYAMGCKGIILDERNWMNAAGVVSRSSAGASELFEIFRSKPEDAADIFKAKGFRIVCADERTDNLLGECEIKTPLLLIVGGEKRGISRALLEKADQLVKINYPANFGASLSAASAAAMFAFEIARQNPNV